MNTLSQSSIDKLFMSGAATVIAGAVGLGAYAIYESGSDPKWERMERQAEAMKSSVNSLSQADGFDSAAIDERHYINPNGLEAGVSLNLGKCTLNGVSITVERAADDMGVTDIVSYHFSKRLDPTVKQVTSGGKFPRTESYIANTQTANFDFKNMSELQGQLGGEPCITIAQTIPDQDPRTPVYDY